MGTETLERLKQSEQLQTWTYPEHSTSSTATELGGLVVSFLTLGAGLDPRSTLELVTTTVNTADQLEQPSPTHLAKQR